MAWYWFVLIVVGFSAITLLLGYVWAKKSNNPVDDGDLLKIQKQSYEAQIAAQKQATAEAAQAAKDLLAERNKISAWYGAAKSKIDKEARDEFEKLSTDPDALNAKLDALLGKP